MRSVLLLLFAGCGNALPPPGSCEVSPGAAEPVVTPVLFDPGGDYDDLAFSRALGMVVAAPQRSGFVYLVDPSSLAQRRFEVPRGSSSADASTTTVYVAERDNHEILALDLQTGVTRARRRSHAGRPDYVRVAPTTGEVWVSLPARNLLEILDPETLAPIGALTLPGPPEGLTFDDSGHAYVNNHGTVVGIDVRSRVVIGEWDIGCGLSHGFPQVDLAYGLVFGGCKSAGGAGVATLAGELVAGFEAGGEEAVLAYDPVRHHLYLRGDPGTSLSILAVCPSGELAELAKVPIPELGHAAVTDGLGNVWLADPVSKGVIRISDPFPGT